MKRRREETEEKEEERKTIKLSPVEVIRASLEKCESTLYDWKEAIQQIINNER